MERALRSEYSAMIFRHLDKAKPHDWPRLVALAKSAELVRSYDHKGRSQCREVPDGVRPFGKRHWPRLLRRPSGAWRPAVNFFHEGEHSPVTLPAGTARIVRPAAYMGLVFGIWLVSGNL